MQARQNLLIDPFPWQGRDWRLLPKTHARHHPRLPDNLASSHMFCIAEKRVSKKGHLVAGRKAYIEVTKGVVPADLPHIHLRKGGRERSIPLVYEPPFDGQVGEFYVVA